MNALGIIFHSDFGHPAACLLRDGELVALGEEERFVRVKGAKGYFPGHSIRYCLEAGGMTLKDIDRIAFGWDANKYTFSYPLFLGRNFISHRFFKRRASPSEHVGRQSQGSALIDGFKDILSTHPKSLKQSIVFGFREAGFHEDLPPITFVNHHLCHAATAFFCSGLAESAVLVCDGHGEENTITIWKGQGDTLTPLSKTNIPHSLGWFYALFTEFLGWNPNEGEVKLMGLAPFGKPNREVQDVVDSILRLEGDSVELDSDYMFYNKRSYGRFFSDLLVDKLGLPRGRDEEITDHHRDIAAAVQTRLEQAGVHLARTALKLSDSRNLCLAGGVALNCKMNGHIHAQGFVDNLFVQPVSYDAGVALGAAQVVARESGDDVRFTMEHLYYGPSYDDEEIESVLRRNKIAFRKSDDVAAEAARYIYDGRIVAWFQGGMEVGPRTLGARSILADPRDPGMKDKVNDRVKFRENWRPFALSLLEEHKEEYLEHPVDSPFMIMAFGVPEEKRQDIPSAMHGVDHSTRPQTVSRKTNPLYWKLIDAFKTLSGVPGVLNTSFNIKGEPVVCSPSDALRCFFGTGLDVLVIGDYIVEKPVQETG
jgi:carbamoyltransferase